MLLQFFRLETVAAQLDDVIAGRDVGRSEAAIWLDGPDLGLVYEDLGSDGRALQRKRSEFGDGLKGEGEGRLSAFADADFLIGNVLEARFDYVDGVIFRLEIGNAQLAAARGTLLQLAVQENFGTIFSSGNDKSA